MVTTLPKPAEAIEARYRLALRVASSPVHDIPVNAHAVALTTVPAPIEACFAVAIDVEAYPAWVQGMLSVDVEEVDEIGRPRRVRFEATAMGRRTTYVLAYDLSEAPGQLSWSLVEGDLTTKLEGAYFFEPSETAAAGEVATDVTYQLSVDLAVPLPGYVKRRAEDKIIEAALERFKARILAELDS